MNKSKNRSWAMQWKIIFLQVDYRQEKRTGKNK